MFYLLPLLVAAHFHGAGFVRLSVAVAVFGHYAAQCVPLLVPGVDATDALGTATARAIPVGTALAAVALIVHGLRDRDRAQQADLQRMAHTDPLTELSNRRGLRLAIDELQVHAGNCTIVMIDLDHFKAINDGEGHEVGDRVLQATAAALRQLIGPGDLAVRFGGEEFVVLLQSPALDAAAPFTDGLALALREIGASQKPVTASFGVTPWAKGEPFSAAIRRADAAVYEAKEAGRDRCVLRPAPADIG